MSARDLTPVQLDQREYFAHMGQQAAERRAAQLEATAAKVRSAELGTYRYGAAAAAELAAQEWRGIAKACLRERNRLARIKHGRTR